MSKNSEFQKMNNNRYFFLITNGLALKLERIVVDL